MAHLLVRLLPQSGLLRVSPLAAQTSVSLLRSLSTAPVQHETTKEELASFFSQHEVRVLGGSLTDLIQRFSDAPFSKSIVAALQNHYEQPTPIQSIAWPVALTGKDMVGLAHTGTGKTLGFLLPAFLHIQKLRAQQAKEATQPGFKIQPKVLVLAPTRELAIQIFKECERFQQIAGVSAAVVFGGQQVKSQLPPLLRQNRGKPIELIVGTPGRVIDLLQNHGGIFDISKVTFAVLDEADRMLDMGFEPQVREILAAMPGAKINDPQDGSQNAGPAIQTMMWSATWPKEVRLLAADFLRDHLTVRVGSDDLQAPTTIQQNFEYCLPAARFDRLMALLAQWRTGGTSKILIFCEKKLTVDFLQEMLASAGIRARAMHGDKTQSFRENTLAAFRRDRDGVLIATEVAARGLDVSDISHVVNYEMPLQAESYVHRIGRTGRAGQHGIAHSFFDSGSSGIAKDLVDVLVTSGQEVPSELQALKELNAPSRPPQRKNNIRPDFRRSGGRPTGFDRYGGDRYGGDRYGGDRYGGSSGGDRYGGSDRYSGSSSAGRGERFDRFGGDRYSPEERRGGYEKDDRFGGDRFSRRFDSYGDDTGSRPRSRLSEGAASSSSSFQQRSMRFDAPVRGSRFENAGRSRLSLYEDDDQPKRTRKSDFDDV